MPLAGCDYIKSREHGTVTSQAVVVATAVNQDGYRFCPVFSR